MGVKAGLDPSRDDRRHQRRVGSDHGFGRKISAGDSAAHVRLRVRDGADAQRRAALRRRKREAWNVPNSVMSIVLDQWETTNKEFGGESDFTAIVKMVETRAGVIVGKKS